MKQYTYTLRWKPDNAKETDPAKKLKSWQLPEKIRVRTLREDYTLSSDSEAFSLALQVIEEAGWSNRRYALIRDDGKVIFTAREFTPEELAADEERLQRIEESKALEQKLNAPIPDYQQQTMFTVYNNRD